MALYLHEYPELAPVKEALLELTKESYGISSDTLPIKEALQCAAFLDLFEQILRAQPRWRMGQTLSQRYQDAKIMFEQLECGLLKTVAPAPLQNLLRDAVSQLLSGSSTRGRGLSILIGDSSLATVLQKFGRYASNLLQQLEHFRTALRWAMWKSYRRDNAMLDMPCNLQAVSGFENWNDELLKLMRENAAQRGWYGRLTAHLAHLPIFSEKEQRKMPASTKTVPTQAAREAAKTAGWQLQGSPEMVYAAAAERLQKLFIKAGIEYLDTVFPLCEKYHLLELARVLQVPVAAEAQSDLFKKRRYTEICDDGESNDHISSKQRVHSEEPEWCARHAAEMPS
jgi:hypothetical protein